MRRISDSLLGTAMVAALVWCCGANVPCDERTSPWQNSEGSKGWCPPRNSDEYPRWPFCNRKPSQTQAPFDSALLPPEKYEPYDCSQFGQVLRQDADGIICADYSHPQYHEMAAGSCTTKDCCAVGNCGSHSCPTGWTKKNVGIDCIFAPCTDNLCCDPPGAIPQSSPLGFFFVDVDPGLNKYGGKLTIMRAPDESDIDYYRVYWVFSGTYRKKPSGNLANPVSWTRQHYVRDGDKYVLGTYEKTGEDIVVDIPMGTQSPEACGAVDPVLARSGSPNRFYMSGDPCLSYSWVVVAGNANGERMDLFGPQYGGKSPILDYEAEQGLCAESGVAQPGDLPTRMDRILSGEAQTAQECARLCREYVPPNPGMPYCRWWQWGYGKGKSKGANSYLCWMEGQMMEKQHYGVRIGGPAVCPTSQEATATGKERTRCTRWRRLPYTAPFVYESCDQNNDPLGCKGLSRDEAWRGNDYGWQHIYGVRGTSLQIKEASPERCKARCDEDSLCLGFVYMNRDPSDLLYHACMLLHHDTGERHVDGGHEMWLCSRENRAPLINGYDLQKEPFGFKKCSDAAMKEGNTENYDSCAEACECATGCMAFTYTSGTKTCQLYSSCTLQAVPKGDPRAVGCELDGCYDGYGAATYFRQMKRTYSLVFDWPNTFVNDDGSLTISVESNGGLDGADILCSVILGERVVDWDGKFVDNRTAIPETAAGMLADSNLVFVRTTFKDDATTFNVPSEARGHPFTMAQMYTVQCALTEPEKYQADPFIKMHVETRLDPHWLYVGDFECRANTCVNNGDGYPLDVSKRPYSMRHCQEECEAIGCSAFWYDWKVGHCHVKKKNTCVYDKNNKDHLGFQCYRRIDEYTDWFRLYNCKTGIEPCHAERTFFGPSAPANVKSCPELTAPTPEPPVGTPEPPAPTPEPPVSTPEPPVNTPEPPVSTPEPPAPTPEPPVNTPEPPVGTPEPPAPTPEPPVNTPEPPVSTPEPPAPTPEPPGSTPEPPAPTPEPPAPTPGPETNECDQNPCGDREVCRDPNLSSSADFVCTCPGGESAVGKPVGCFGTGDSKNDGGNASGRDEQRQQGGSSGNEGGGGGGGSPAVIAVAAVGGFALLVCMGIGGYVLYKRSHAGWKNAPEVGSPNAPKSPQVMFDKTMGSTAVASCSPCEPHKQAPFGRKGSVPEPLKTNPLPALPMSPSELKSPMSTTDLLLPDNILSPPEVSIGGTEPRFETLSPDDVDQQLTGTAAAADASGNMTI